MKRNSARKTKKNSPLYLKMCVPMILLVILQLITFLCVLMFSGEFSTIKKYAYNVLTEKTRNRSSYIENALNQKTSLVYESAGEVNDIVSEVLKNEKKTINDIKSDKKLNKKIIASSAETIVSLLRRDMVNDAYIILNTDELYKDGGINRLTGLYIRDTDIDENDVTENQDLFLEMGSSAIAHDMGITMDFEWSLYIDVTDDNDFSFFYEPIKAYENNPGKVYNMGYWSRLSKISRSAEKSIKYTLPLVSEDGTVYGVIGVGILEKSIQKSIPSNDFLNDSACYVLGHDIDNNDIYDHQLHSGAAYTRLVNDKTVFGKGQKNEYNLYSYDTNVPTVGSINDINLYSKASPFKDQRWALISIADSEQILEIYNMLIKIFLISSVISITFSIVCALILSRRVTKPVSHMIRTLESDAETDSIVEFESSSITEIDKLGEAIIDLQMNVREQAFRVSNILSMADTGIGVFMYDCQSGSVFVGKSLIKMLDFSDISSENDVTISFERFKKYLERIDEESDLFDMDIFSDKYDKSQKFSASLEVNYNKNDEMSLKWLRFTLTRDNNNVIGLVQDITKTVIERKKIEHERDYDITTGLFNRRAFYNRIDALFREPEKLGIAAFIMVDLDNLKFVNDTYGHDFGDDYIRTAADVLRTMEMNNAVVARLSGDEFLAFIYGAKSKDEIREIIRQTRKKMINSYCILADGTHYKIRASGGYSWYPDDSKSYEALIKYADFAMYTIKHSTKGNIAEFNESSYINDSILVTGIEEMNRIIDNGDIKYAFQPIINAKNGELYGYEALMRPQSQIITSVLEFIRIAKSSAKLYEIERLTWFLGMDSFAVLIKKGIIPKGVKLFINSISNCILDVGSQRIVEKKYSEILSDVVMEVLESEQINKDYADKKQNLMSRWNAKIALDDFGTGYNSEYALITMNPDIIKIDRSIISGCDKDKGKRIIIENLVKIAKDSKIMVLAEGVETYDEMKTVYKCGVDLFQGYYFSKPMFEPKGIDDNIKAQIKELNGII